MSGAYSARWLYVDVYQLIRLLLTFIYKIIKMKKLLVILCMCAGIGGTMSAAQVLRDGGTNARVCLVHEYQWQEDAIGNITVTEGDPLYCGGWTATLVDGEVTGTVTVEGGLTPYRLAQPMTIDMTAGRVTIAASEEPFATVSTTGTTVAGGVTTRVDSVRSYYVVNEAWFTEGAALADVTGEILADGTIHIADGYAYYIETTVTTTVTGRDGKVRTSTDETVAMSPIYRDTWLLVANGKHEFVNESDGTMNSVDVNIRQSGDTVWVTNLYGYGAPEAYMLLSEDGTMSYPSQMLRDIPAEMSPSGNGMWMNMGGNSGNVTTEAITWGLTTPGDNAQTWDGWRDNRLYYTDGTQFVIPGGESFLRGDVDNNGEVKIGDVTALISYLLSGDPTGVNLLAADCDQNGDIKIGDVTALISYLLSGTW